MRMGILEKGLDEVRGDVKEIRDNHLSHIQGSLNVVVNDMDWIKRFFWILATSSIGSMIANIVGFMSKNAAQ